MREILFRGKNTDKDKWFYGDLFHTEKDFKKVVEIIDFNKKPYTHIIDSSTIGQFTGLTDKNGTKVFEGDIVRFTYYKPSTIIAEIKYIPDESGFMMISNEVYYRFSDDQHNSITVIGNIHDNPKLIE